MSDLKHRSFEELEYLEELTVERLRDYTARKRELEVQIRSAGSHQSGQYERLKWIRRYMKQKKKVPATEVTIAQIEEHLGYPIKIVKE